MPAVRDEKAALRTVLLPVAIPYWARYLATDADGLVCAYEHPPAPDSCCEQWLKLPRTRLDVVAYGPPCPEWRHTLRPMGEIA
jgi:hypothetical protein